MHKETAEDDALEAALAASMRQFHYEQELAKQREILAGGGGGAFVHSLLATPAAPAPYQPMAAAAPTAVPLAAPPAASLMFAAPKHAATAPQAPHNWVFGDAPSAAPEAAAEADDDDDLGCLLALCGVEA
jgi:hypothetical protein